jgi:Uma2 family endonuclease
MVKSRRKGAFMESALTEPKNRVVIEEHVILRGVSWKAYEQLIKDHEDQSAPRFIYTNGILEIYMPSQKHEKKAGFLADIVRTIAEERETEILSLRSMTFKKDSTEKGVEPDGCFYLQSYDEVFGMEKIDLELFPPDLVIEIDIFRPSINSFPIYAEFKVPEIWRYANDEVKIHLFDGESYAETAESRALPKITGELLIRLLAESESMKRSAWLKNIRDWARGQN